MTVTNEILDSLLPLLLDYRRPEAAWAQDAVIVLVR
jgi:hypothetical protein